MGGQGSGNFKSRFTPEQVAGFVDRIKNGESIASVARQAGVSYQAVSQWCQKAGVVSSFRRDQVQNEEDSEPVDIRHAPRRRALLEKYGLKAVNV